MSYTCREEQDLSIPSSMHPRIIRFTAHFPGQPPESTYLPSLRKRDEPYAMLYRFVAPSGDEPAMLYGHLASVTAGGTPYASAVDEIHVALHKSGPAILTTLATHEIVIDALRDAILAAQEAKTL